MAIRTAPVHRAILLLLIVRQFMVCGPALAQDRGGTAACVCYCGISLRPPCGDDACKRACGWKEPPTSTGGNNPAAAAAGAIGNAISSGITNAINQSRARAEQERQDQLRAVQENRNMHLSVDAMMQEQLRADDERLQHAGEQARRLDDQRREETLTTLQGIPQSDELTLKPSTDLFGIPGNPKGDSPSPGDPSAVDLRHLDPDKPVTVDQDVLKDDRDGGKKERAGLADAECEKRKAARNRLAQGLPVQREAIRRTEAQLKAAQEGIVEADAEKRQVLLQGAIQEAQGYATDVLTSAKVLRSQVALLKDMDIDKGKRDLLIRSLNTAIFEAEAVAGAARAGYEGGEELRTRVDKLSGQILPAAGKLLLESGIAEKVGEGLAGKIWGPLGELGFRGARLSIDFTVALGKGRITKTERDSAQRNLEVMRGQQRRAEQRIAELDRDLAEGCRQRLPAQR